MPSEIFPVFPQIGDYVKVKTQVTSDKVVTMEKGEIAVVLHTSMEVSKEKDCFEWTIKVGVKSGRILIFSYSKYANSFEVIPANSPAYKILYGN